MDKFDELDYPHRWDKGSPELGQWVLGARDALIRWQPVDVRSKTPAGLTVLVADNTSLMLGRFMLEKGNGRQVRNTIKSVTTMMILSGQNATVRGVNAYLGRSVPIREGHTREALSELAAACLVGIGKPVAIAEA
ncbi:hypothetical protein [Glaciimonas sp. PCH181]|uniref:hypothetical protein n=1 Tax=Glaciimonas sp. PCH181 TaxID=2133943 RepID=UPI000D3B38D3|nr:hypothetical protein [Glaciimonas sp. PCH181]PUA19733.1 hypothetical protein C7W93_07865 [Glaciimonas sp. PCH181]